MNKSRLCHRVAAACLVVALSAVEANAAVTYQITHLGTLGGSTSTARDINSSGQVVGHSHVAGDGSQHAFIWDADNGMSDLGTLSGYPYNYGSAAYAINESGQAVGASGLPADIQNAVLWDPVLGIIDLGTLGGNVSHAYGVSNDGTVVGDSRFEPANRIFHAFAWDAVSGMVDLGAPGGDDTRIYAINASAQMVGCSQGYGSPDAGHAILWDPVDGVIDLGTLGGIYGSAQDISDDGTVIGQSTLIDGSMRPFIWDVDNGMTDLGTFGGNQGSGVGINDVGQVVGFSSLADGSLRAFIWDTDSGMVDLNTLTPFDSQWELQIAYAINDNGLIVGFGEYEGQRRAFLLTPTVVPAPPAILLGVMGLGLAGRRLKKGAKAARH